MRANKKFFRYLHPEIFYILTGFVVIRMYLFLRMFHFPLWDEAVFLGMGRFIYSSGKYGIWEMIRPPGFPLVLSFGSFTGNVVLFGEIIMLVFGLGCILLTYLISLRFYSRRAAFISAFLLAITPVFVEGTVRIMTGVPSMFFCLLSLYLLIEKREALSGIFCAVAFLFRFPAGIMIIPLLIHARNRPRLLGYFSGVVAVFLSYNQIVYGSMLMPLIEASHHQSTFIGNKYGMLYVFFYPAVLLMSNPGLAGVFGKAGKRRAEILYPLIVFLLYFTLIPHKQERFALLFLPYVAILSGQALSLIKKNHALFFLIAAVPLVHIYNWGSLHETRPDMSVYSSFHGLVLTSDPLYAVYSDARFIHFYDDPHTANEVLSMYIDDADAIIYNPDSFPWDDPDSVAEKEEMVRKIEKTGYEVSSSGNTLIYRRDS